MKDTILNGFQISVSILVLLSAGSLAHVALGRVFPRADLRTRRLLACIVATVSIGYLSFLLGQAHALYRGVFMGLWLFVVVLGALPLARDVRAGMALLGRSLRAASPLEKCVVAVVLLRTLVIFLGGTMQWPYGGSEADALHYHLVLPRVYMEQHSMAPLTWSIPDKYPLLLHMVSLAGFAVIGPLFAKTLALFAYMGSLLLVFRMSVRFAPRPWPLLAAAAFGGVPAMVIQAGTAMIDLLTLFFLLAALEGILRHRETGDRAAFFVAALAAGVVAASRAFTVAHAVLLAILFHFAHRSERGTCLSRLRRTALFLGCVAILYLPWVIRAQILTGNPVYPLGFRWLGGEGLDAARAAGLESVAVAYGAGKGVLAAFLVPWNLTFRFAPFDYPVGPIILAWLPIVLFFSPWKSMRLLMLAMTAYAVVWFAGSQQTRYLYFSISLFFVFVAAATARVANMSRAVGTLCIALLVANIGLSCLQAYRQYARGWDRLLTGESKESYLRRYVRHADSLGMVASHTPSDAKVLLLDTYPEYLFYFPRRFVQGGAGVLTTTYWDASAQTPASFVGKLAEHGISHMLADKSTAELTRYLSSVPWKLLAENDRFALYEKEAF